MALIHIDMAFGANEAAMVKDIVTTFEEMVESIGAVDRIRVPARGGVPGSFCHEAGTARMGRDPKTSFLNRWNQSHEVSNLFVLDAAAFPTNPCQNPTLTIMALAARASDYLVSEMTKRNL